MASGERMITCKSLMTVFPPSLLPKFVGMENNEVVGCRNWITSQTLSKLFTPLPDSDSGFPTCNESLMTDDDLLTLQQLADHHSS
jgi:hypothetical protein